MSKIFSFVPVFLALSFPIISLHAAPPPGYELKWRDEFEGTELDKTKWTYWEPGQRRHALNVPEAVTVADGNLTITTYTEGNQHFTAMVTTEGLFEAHYGYYEARIQWADAPGTWSAFWSYSRNMEDPNSHAVDGMEIDIVEHRATDEEGRPIPGKANFTLHWDGYEHRHNGAGFQTPDIGLDDGFHLYGLEWTPEAYRFFVNGQLYWETKGPISRHPQFLILSTEVESGLWSSKTPEGGYGDRASSNVKLVVDYVRFYEKR